MSYINLKQNKAFREKIYKCLSTQFDGKKSSYMRKTLKHNMARDIARIMFYDKSKSLIFKVLVVFVYCFIDKHVCVGYLCLQIEAKVSLLHIGFEYTSFYVLSGICIPEFLLNIMLCYGYIK